MFLCLFGFLCALIVSCIKKMIILFSALLKLVTWWCNLNLNGKYWQGIFLSAIPRMWHKNNQNLGYDFFSEKYIFFNFTIVGFYFIYIRYLIKGAYSLILVPNGKLRGCARLNTSSGLPAITFGKVAPYFVGSTGDRICYIQYSSSRP